MDDASRVNSKLSGRGSSATKKREESIDRSGSNNDMRRLGVVDVLNYSSKIWKGQEHLAEMVTTETVRILRKAHEKEPTFFQDKNKKWVLGGLFYLIGRKMNVTKTQKHIARCLNTDGATIRNSYLEWLRHFPEFWPETTTHLEEKFDEKSPLGPHSRMDKFL